MATEPILQLRDALIPLLNTALSTAIGSPVVIEPRYSPYLDPDELEVPKWLAIISAETINAQLRGLAPGELSIEIGFQVALPEIEDRDAEFFDTATLDGYVEQLGKLKQLYRPGGSMRGVRVAGCEFRRYTHAPLYRPDLLVGHGLFVSAVTLVYYCEHNDDDND